MAEFFTRSEYDGDQFVFEVHREDGTVVKLRQALGGRSDAEHAADELALRNAYAGLRQWATDAQAVFDAWPTRTAAQKDATQREVIRRFGLLCDRMADLLRAQNLDQ